jgi:hypothetical protein
MARLKPGHFFDWNDAKIACPIPDLLNGFTRAVLLMCADGHVGGKIERPRPIACIKALFENPASLTVITSRAVARRPTVAKKLD